MEKDDIMEKSIEITITGESTIIHRIRILLGLTIAEYVLADFVFNWNRTNDHMFVASDVYKFFGTNMDALNPVFASLNMKGILIPEKSEWKVTDKWNQYFNIDADFEEVWKILYRKGSKDAALKKYLLCRKNYSAELLKESAMKYIATKNPEEPQFMMGVSKFFGPDKHFLNDHGPAFKPKVSKPDKPKIGNMYDEGNR